MTWNVPVTAVMHILRKMTWNVPVTAVMHILRSISMTMTTATMKAAATNSLTMKAVVIHILRQAAQQGSRSIQYRLLNVVLRPRATTTGYTEGPFLRIYHGMST
jgi:hypothetical protein